MDQCICKEVVCQRVSVVYGNCLEVGCCFSLLQLAHYKYELNYMYRKGSEALIVRGTPRLTV